MAEKVQSKYDELTQISGKFTQQASQVEALKKSLQSALQPLQDGGWKGLGSEKFFEEMTNLIFPKIDKLHTALTEAKSTTDQVAQTLKQAEEESHSLFSQL